LIGAATNVTDRERGVCVSVTGGKNRAALEACQPLRKLGKKNRAKSGAERRPWSRDSRKTNSRLKTAQERCEKFPSHPTPVKRQG